MRDRRTRFAAVGAALVAALGLAATAAAHGGDLVGSAEAGPYLLELYSAGVSQGAMQGIDYTVYVRSQATGFPVDDASVRMTVTRIDGTRVGPAAARGFANGYDVVVPAGELADREGQRVAIAIETADGVVRAEIPVHGPRIPAARGGGGSPSWLWPVVGVALALGLAVLVALSVRSDRRRSRPAGTDRGRPDPPAAGPAAAPEHGPPSDPLP